MSQQTDNMTFSDKELYLKVPNLSGTFIKMVTIWVIVIITGFYILALPDQSKLFLNFTTLEIVFWAVIASLAIVGVILYMIVILPFRKAVKQWATQQYGLDLTSKEISGLTTSSRWYAIGENFESKQTFITGTGSYNSYVLTFDKDDEAWELQDDSFEEYLEITADAADEELPAMERLSNVLAKTLVFWRIHPKSDTNIYTKDANGRESDVFWTDKEELLDFLDETEMEDTEIQFLTKQEMVSEVLPDLWMRDRGIFINTLDDELHFSQVQWFYALMKLPFPEFVRKHQGEKAYLFDSELEVVPDDKDEFLPFKILSLYLGVGAVAITAGFFLFAEKNSVAVLAAIFAFGMLRVIDLAFKKKAQFASKQDMKYLRKNITRWAKARYDVDLTRNQSEILSQATDNEEDKSNVFSSGRVTITHPIYSEPVECYLVQSDYKFLLVDSDKNELMPYSHSSLYSRYMLVKDALESGGLYMVETVTEEEADNPDSDSEKTFLLGDTFLDGKTSQIPLFWSTDIMAAHFVNMMKKADPTFNGEVKHYSVSDIIEQVLPTIVGDYDMVGTNWEVCIEKEAFDMTQFINLVLEAEQEESETASKEEELDA